MIDNILNILQILAIVFLFSQCFNFMQKEKDLWRALYEVELLKRDIGSLYDLCKNIEQQLTTLQTQCKEWE